MNSDNGIGYGICECGAPLVPIWFQEEETKVIGGFMHYTGRVRTACSHLECYYCGKRYPVDDTFDGPWR